MKKIALGFATCGLILSSCSSNDVFEDNQGTNNPNMINFSATTTRATVNNLESLQKDQNGFGVYATSGTNTDWYITAQTYKFTKTSNDNDPLAGTWNWAANSATKNWPTATTGYPMNFYAYYPINDPTTPDNFKLDSESVGILTAEITIQKDPEHQIDFLAANYENVTTKPAGGKLNLNFQHITSKVNFSIIAGYGADVFVQQMHMNNVGNTGTYRYNSVTAGEEAERPARWTTSLEGGTLGKYKYWPIEAVPENATGGETILTTFDLTGSDATEKKVTPMYPYIVENKPQYNKDDRHMMLRPQLNTPGWTWTKPETTFTRPIVPTTAYIESVYRIEANGDVNAVGYQSAANHPNYKAGSYSGPLFVKVGFPLGEKLTWAPGRGYMYSLMLGTAAGTGGIILDDNYYDNKGNRTDLTIDGKEEGDKVNDGEIHFNVTVSEWGDDINGEITQQN